MKKVTKNNNGLSPVIATVLLIAMVVVIALLVFLWMRSLAQESITKFEGENINLVCQNVKFEADYSGGVLTIRNTGTVPIFEMLMTKYTDKSHEAVTIDKSMKWPETGLNQGGAYSNDVSLNGIEKIILSPILLGTSDSGKKKFECDILQTGMEIQI